MCHCKVHAIARLGDVQVVDLLMHNEITAEGNCRSTTVSQRLQSRSPRRQRSRRPPPTVTVSPLMVAIAVALMVLLVGGHSGTAFR